MKLMENENIPPVVEENKISQCCSDRMILFFRISVIVLGILIVIGLFANAYLMFSKKENTPITKDYPLTAVPTTDSTSTLSVYNDNNVSFEFPFDFYPQQLKTTKEGYIRSFKKENERFITNLYFQALENLDPDTGKPYPSLDKYIGLSYNLDTVMVDGLEGRQLQPHGGAENDNSVVFFSKDLKKIYLIGLEVGSNDDNLSGKLTEADIVAGQKIFNQVLLTVKFVPQTKAEHAVANGLTTYKHSSCGRFPDAPFSIKIPVGWEEIIEGGGEKFYTTYTYYNKDEINLSVTCGDGFGGGGCGETYPLIQDKFLINKKEVNGCMEWDKENDVISLRLTYLSPEHFSFEAKAADTLDNKNLINQILSTFELTP